VAINHQPPLSRRWRHRHDGENPANRQVPKITLALRLKN
jgi:hypothetical protein